MQIAILNQFYCVIVYFRNSKVDEDFAAISRRNSLNYYDVEPQVQDNPGLNQYDMKEKRRPTLQRRESTSKLQNAAKLLRRSLSGKNLSNKYKSQQSVRDENQPVAEPPKRSNSLAKLKRRSLSSSNFSVDCGQPSIEQSPHPDPVEKKPREKRSHSFHGRGDAKKLAKVANLVRRDSTNDVRNKKEKKAAASHKRQSVDVASLRQKTKSVDGSKSCEDLLDFCGNNVYADLHSLRSSEPDPAAESTTNNAKSILLTEDNLITLRFDDQDDEGGFKGPDLIQNLPRCLRGSELPTYTSQGGPLKPDDTYETKAYQETDFDEVIDSDRIYQTLQR